MKALRLIAHGTPGQFELADMAMPEPAPDELLGYALLRLTRKIGEAPIGASTGEPEREAEDRGWVDIPMTRWSYGPGTPVFILGYGESGSLRLSYSLKGIVDVNLTQTRVRYAVETSLGMSGAPCFDQNLELLAMHQGSWSDFVEGVPTLAIRALLHKRHKYGGINLTSGNERA